MGETYPSGTLYGFGTSPFMLSSTFLMFSFWLQPCVDWVSGLFEPICEQLTGNCVGMTLIRPIDWLADHRHDKADASAGCLGSA